MAVVSDLKRLWYIEESKIYMIYMNQSIW